MKIAVIDDFSDCRKLLKEYLLRYMDRYYAGITLTIDEFDNGGSFLDCFTLDAYDLILLDFYMDGLDGLTTARRIRGLDLYVPVIFITTSPDHAIDSYQVRASGYLLKPFGYDTFEQTISLARIDKILDGHFIELGGEKILLKEIVFCDQDRHYVQIHTARRGVLRYRASFSDLSGLLACYPWFLPCYRCCLVNLKRVTKMEDDGFLMDTGVKVHFRIRKRDDIAKKYSRFLFDQTREEARR